jgi:hypothetical protein
VRWVCALDSPQLLLNMPGTSTSTASNNTSNGAAAATAAPCSTVMASPPSRGQEAGQGELNRSAATTAIVGTGHNTQKRFSHLKSALTRRFPFPSRPALFPLPSSYTQLHSQLTAMGGYAFPALCLLCGAVLDANGRGKCATHSMICNKDAGVIFLLQVRAQHYCLSALRLLVAPVSAYCLCPPTRIDSRSIYVYLYPSSSPLLSSLSPLFRTVLCYSLSGPGAPISPHHTWTTTVRSTSIAEESPST